MAELNHECGVAAIYHLPTGDESSLCLEGGRESISSLLPRMLQDIQNRGQLAAGMTSFNPNRSLLLDTMKDIGTVSEVFRLSHRGKSEAIMEQYAGRAAIGHVRYATCGQDDRSYAQPFERQHIHKNKWFSFCFNGQLANYKELKEKLTREGEHHLARDTDTEIIMHEIGRELTSGPANRNLIDVFAAAAKNFDGAYSLALLNARGELLLARDPLGIKPLCYAMDGALFAAASESVALLNLGFDRADIKSVPPGSAVLVTPDGMRIEQFCEVKPPAHCFLNGSISRTLPARWTTEAYISREQDWEKSWHASNWLGTQSRSTAIPLSSPSLTPAKQRRMRWHTACASQVAKV